MSDDVDKEMRAISRRSFMWAGANIVALAGAWKWLVSRPDAEGILRPLRQSLEFNESLARKLQSGRGAPEFPGNLAVIPPTNGVIGLGDDDDLDPESWKIKLEGAEVSLAEVRALPKFEVIAEFKCVEGWSKVVHWGGARFQDFVQKYSPSQSGVYVAFETPDGAYYVGIDWESAIHPQTLLCYEMNGQPLTSEHGAPLRLVIPIKYGFKSLKRIGRIRYSQNRPPDYWAEQGYDYYSGH